MKTIISLIIIGFASCYVSYSQQNEYEAKLTSAYEQMMNADYSTRYDSLAPSFKNTLKKVLLQSEAIGNPFDSISTKLKIVQSIDGKLRTFSWDEMTGGSWHDMEAIAQYVTPNKQVRVKQLDTDKEMELGGYTDAIIYKIHDIEINDITHYLTFGYGTHGSGNHHEIVQIFRIEENDLVKYNSCFAGMEELVIEASRGDKIDLLYDSTKHKISYNKFIANEETGRFYPTGEKFIWKLINGEFIKE